MAGQLLRTYRIMITRYRPWFYLAAAALITGVLAVVVTPLSSSRRPVETAEDNPVQIENRLRGTTRWRVTNAADDTGQQIKGYASAVSVNVGQRIDFYVSVHPAQTYSIDIFRFGYYQGLGARLVQSRDQLPGVAQPPCPMDQATGMNSCNWSRGYSVTVPLTWTSGVFLAKLTNAAGFQNYITFVVRDDSRRSDLLYQQSVTTYQAYNNYPNDAKGNSSTPATGKSLYDFNSSARRTSGTTNRAVKVSYDRPYADEGAGDFLEYESYFVRWLEQNGYDATYSTDVDTDLHGERLRNHRAFLSVGHDEYWSKAMVDAAEGARDHGVSLGFFGGNAVYWQIRFEASAGGRPNRVQVCYKDVGLDPVKDKTATVQWRNPPVNRVEQHFLGGMFVAQQPGGSKPAPYVVTNSSHWAYAGTGLRDGDSVPGIVGYEADRRFSDQPGPPAAADTYVALSRSPFTAVPEDDENGQAHAKEYQESVLYQAPSGTWVFDAGSIEWSWGLYDDIQVNADPRIQRMTANLLNRFIAELKPPPAAPAGFTATPSAAAVRLSWQKSTDAANLILERSTTPAFDAGTASVTLPGTASTYDDERLARGTYYYRIRAISPNGKSSFATAPVSTAAYTSRVNERSGLIANWRLGEGDGSTAWDTTARYNGSYVGHVRLKAPGAIARDPDGAAEFDGATGRVALPALPESVNFTVMGWTYLTNAGNGNHTLYGDDGTVRLLARPGVPTSETTGYGAVWLNGKEYNLQPPVPGSNLDTWVQWALTREGKTLTLYRNGVPVAKRSDLPANAPARLSGTIGGQSSGAYPLTGRIDEVAVYRRALPAADVSNDYVTALDGLAPPPAATPTTSYRDVVLSEDTLVSYWRLDDKDKATAADSKGTSPGTYVRSVTLGATGALAHDRDTAAQFNGVDQWVNLPQPAAVGDFTIEGWTNLTNPSSLNNTMYGATGAARLLARPGTPSSPLAAYAGVWLAGKEYYLQPNSPAPNVNTWVHWVLTRQGGTLTLYRNGAWIGQRTDLPPTATANISGAIGAQGGTAFFLTGSVDDVAVYRGALSPAQVTQHYKAALYGPAPR
jgi:hypothetical protein